jgi:hypothetical protein
MSKQDIYKFTRRAYKLLKDEDFLWKFKRYSDVTGRHYGDGIGLDPRRDIISTLVHEVLHDMYPDLDEPAIEGRERAMMVQLSHKQLINLLKGLSFALERGISEKDCSF